MKFLVAVILTFFAFSDLYATTGDSVREYAGKILMAVGDVTVTDNKLKRRSKIYKGDVIVTAAGASAQIKFKDGTLLNIQSDAKFDLADYNFNPKKPDEGVFKLNVLAGAIKTATGDIASQSPEKFELSTDLMTIGVRGTIVALHNTNTGTVKSQGVVAISGAIQATMSDGRSFATSSSSPQNALAVTAPAGGGGGSGGSTTTTTTTSVEVKMTDGATVMATGFFTSVETSVSTDSSGNVTSVTSITTDASGNTVTSIATADESAEGGATVTTTTTSSDGQTSTQETESFSSFTSNVSAEVTTIIPPTPSQAAAPPPVASPPAVLGDVAACSGGFCNSASVATRTLVATTHTSNGGHSGSTTSMASRINALYAGNDQWATLVAQNSPIENAGYGSNGNLTHLFGHGWTRNHSGTVFNHYFTNAEEAQLDDLLNQSDMTQPLIVVESLPMGFTPDYTVNDIYWIDTGGPPTEIRWKHAQITIDGTAIEYGYWSDGRLESNEAYFEPGGPTQSGSLDAPTVFNTSDKRSDGFSHWVMAPHTTTTLPTTGQGLYNATVFFEGIDHNNTQYTNAEGFVSINVEFATQTMGWDFVAEKGTQSWYVGTKGTFGSDFGNGITTTSAYNSSEQSVYARNTGSQAFFDNNGVVTTIEQATIGGKITGTSGNTIVGSIKLNSTDKTKNFIGVFGVAK